MSKLGMSRNIILSILDFLESDLVADGWDSVMFVKSWPEDRKIVLPDEYVSDKGLVRPPAININILPSSPLRPVGIGHRTESFYLYTIGLFMYCLTEGQLLDLLEYVDGRFNEPVVITINDYSTTGYPTQNPVELATLDVFRTGMIPRIDNTAVNPAMRNGGVVNISAEIIKKFS